MKNFFEEHPIKLILFTMMICIAFTVTNMDENTLNYLINLSQHTLNITYKILKLISINLFIILNIAKSILKIIQFKNCIIEKFIVKEYETKHKKYKNDSNIDISIHIKIHKK